MIMNKELLKKEFRKLFRSLDFISNNFLNKESRKIGIKNYYTIYQQLGIAWEFLGMQCKHWDGYKKTRDRKEVCKICGKVKGVAENYYLLLKEGPKKIGISVVPNSKKIFSTKEQATIVHDTMNFHGAIINVNVSNAYKSSLFNKKHDITIARDRIVTLKERGIECWIDQHLIAIKMNKKKSGKIIYGGFPWEIKRKNLKNFPVIFDFDKKYQFLGLTIFQ